MGRVETWYCIACGKVITCRQDYSVAKCSDCLLPENQCPKNTMKILYFDICGACRKKEAKKNG